jgi:hypothetical protein
VLQKLMRHSNIHVTMEYYVNTDDAAEQAIAGRESSLRNVSRNSADSADSAEARDGEPEAARDGDFGSCD